MVYQLYIYVRNCVGKLRIYADEKSTFLNWHLKDVILRICVFLRKSENSKYYEVYYMISSPLCADFL